MFPFIHAAALAHYHEVEKEKKRRREEEECMTGYSPEELSGDWQFKIVKGNFKKPRQIEAVLQEQAEFGWVMVEIFDHNRIRFKRPAAEIAKDAYREGNPYRTVSKASGPGCGTTVALLLAVGLGTIYFLLV
jgi:hypothetical protein